MFICVQLNILFIPFKFLAPRKVPCYHICMYVVPEAICIPNHILADINRNNFIVIEYEINIQRLVMS